MNNKFYTQIVEQESLDFAPVNLVSQAAPKNKWIGVSRPPVAQAIRGFFFFLGVECACASKTLNAGKIIRVNGTTTLWEVLVSVCDVLTAKTDVIDINVR